MVWLGLVEYSMVWFGIYAMLCYAMHSILCYAVVWFDVANLLVR